MENKVKEIMEDYKKKVEQIDKKYDIDKAKKYNTKDLDDKINYEKEFIAKLKFEGKEINAELIKKATERLEKSVKEKEEIELKYQEELQAKKDLKKDKVILPSGREVSMEEKDNLEKEDLRNKAIRELTSESKILSEKLNTKKMDLENKRKEWQDFKYIFEKDEQGNQVAINQDEVKKIHANVDKLVKEIEELNGIKEQCEKYLIELKSPRKKDEDLVNAWRKTWEEATKSKEQKVEKEPELAKEKGEEDKQTKKTEKEEQEQEEGIEQKINNVKQEMDKANKDYKNIHISANPTVEKVSLKNGKELNTFEKNNIIDKVKSEMKNEKVYRKEIKLQERKDEVTSIIINEKAGDIYVQTKEGRRTKLSLQEAFDEKKDMYKELDIKGICNDVTEGKRIKALLLQARVNPAIIKALDDKETIKNYISCLNEKKELPFELIHDLRDSKLKLFDKMKMWVYARAEDKIPGTKVSFVERFWNKNKALPRPEETIIETEKRGNLKNLEVENKDNRIEKNAAEIMKNTESKIASEIKEITEENEI